MITTRHVLAPLLLLIISIILIDSRAHTAPLLAGKVLQQGNDRPVAGAQIRVEGMAPTARTAIDGSFSLALPPGRYTLYVIAAGFESSDPTPVAVTDSTPEPLVIRLSSAYMLPGVEIEAERNPDKVGKTTISGTELSQVAGTSGDPLKVLQALPGVTTPNDASSEPAVRGSGPGDNAYYIDFLPVGYLFHAGGLVSVINADLVRDFNLYSAAFGPEFTDVLGAVIDVNLRPPRADRMGGKLNVSLYEADVLLEGPVNETQSFFFGLRRSYIDLFLPKTGQIGDEGVEYREFPSYYDYQGKYLIRPSARDEISIQVGGAADRAKFYIPPDSDIAQHDPDLAGDIANQVRYDAQGVVWSAQPTGRRTNKLAASHLVTDTNSSLGNVGTGRARFDTYYLRDNATLLADDDHELHLGAEYAWSTVDFDLDFKDAQCSEFDPACDFTSATRVQSRDTLRARFWGVHAKDRWRAAQRLTLIGGLRLSHDDYLDELYTEPRLGAEWQWDGRTLLTAGWGKYHQFPDGLQVIDRFGNPDLSNLKGEHSVVGIEFKPGPDWGWKAEAYYKEFEALVVPEPVLRYVNAGSGRAYGLDILVRKQPTDRLWGWLALTLGHSERTNGLNNETFDYQHDQPVIATWVATYEHSARWSYSAKWRYHTGSPYTPIVGTTTDPGGRIRPVYGAINSERLPAYHRLDLRADRRFEFARWKLKAYGELINAYNRDNVGGYIYNADYSDKKAVHQLPILVSFGVQAEF